MGVADPKHGCAQCKGAHARQKPTTGIEDCLDTLALPMSRRVTRLYAAQQSALKTYHRWQRSGLAFSGCF